jgi:hypothetical protein
MEWLVFGIAVLVLSAIAFWAGCCIGYHDGYRLSEGHWRLQETFAGNQRWRDSATRLRLATVDEQDSFHWKTRDEIADEVIAERAKQRQEIYPGWDGQAELLGELFRAQHPVVCGHKVERWSETND